MAIEGPLRELGIHDVFQLLDLSRKTGRLRVSSALRDNEGTVDFHEGRVVAAAIRSNPHQLGGMLVRSGRITEADLDAARREQERGSGRKLGEILVAQGVISARELERSMLRHVEAVVLELLSWQEGFFSFVEGPVDESFGVILPTESLLMEGARRLDEWTQIRTRIPHLGAIPSLADLPAEADPSRMELLPAEWEVLALVDGERDLREIAAVLARSDFEVARTVFGLVATDVIQVREPVLPPATELAEEQVAMCLAEANAAFRERRPADAASHAATAVSLAPNNPEPRVLLARSLIAQGREAEGVEELRHALAVDPRHAVALMESGRIAARHGDLPRATEYWQRVIAAWPASGEAAQARLALDHARELAAVLEGAHA